MNEKEIAHKYVHGEHDALTDNQEKIDLAADILEFAKEFSKNKPPAVMRFRDAPIGARFKYNDDSPIWVKIHSNEGTDGLIVRWHGNIKGFQNYASHCDEFACVDFDTEIFVL